MPAHAKRAVNNCKMFYEGPQPKAGVFSFILTSWSFDAIPAEVVRFPTQGVGSQGKKANEQQDNQGVFQSKTASRSKFLRIMSFLSL